jgi:hypothetical protein
MRINNKSNNTIILENETIRKVADFTYLGINVSEGGGAVKGINIGIQMARGAFFRLWKIWQSTHVHKSKKTEIYNSCVKSVLLYEYMGMRHGWSALRFKENCSISLISARDTSVEFGGLESSLMKNSGRKPTKRM